jgi:putative peptidoglycan binding protein
MGQMADDQVIRSPAPGGGAAREAEELRRVAEIARDIEELGRALEGRDRLARFARVERAKSSPARVGQSGGGVRDRSTAEPEPLPTVADMSSAPKEVSSQVGKFATVPSSPRQRKLVAEGGPPTRSRKWGPSLSAVIIVLFLLSGGALMLTGSPIEIVKGAYRSAVVEMQRENAKPETAAREAAEEKALAEEAEQKAAEEKRAALAAARQEEARQAADGKARAEAAGEIAEAQARAAAQEAAKRQAAEDASLKAEEGARKATGGKPKSDAEVKEQAKRAEADLDLSEQDRKKVQMSLTALGFNTNGTDGAFGPRTRAMIKTWQKTQGLPVTGYLTEAQLATLRQQAAAALAKYDQAQRKVKEVPHGTK